LVRRRKSLVDAPERIADVLLHFLWCRECRGHLLIYVFVFNARCRQAQAGRAQAAMQQPLARATSDAGRAQRAAEMETVKDTRNRKTAQIEIQLASESHLSYAQRFSLQSLPLCMYFVQERFCSRLK
jgi:hypothetical protein